jgi:hypothetical protein
LLARDAGSGGRRGGAASRRAVSGLAGSACTARRAWHPVPIPTCGLAGEAAGQAPPAGVAAKLGDPRHDEGDPQLVLVHLDPSGLAVVWPAR